MPEPLTTALVAELLEQLHVAFPRNLGKQNPQLMVDTYRNGLRGVPGDAVRWAVSRSIEEDQYFPKVARLRQLSQVWLNANRAQVEPRVETAAGWCEGCRTRAVGEVRMRPAVDERGRFRTSADGEWMILVSFERLRCRCDPAPKYIADPECPLDEPGMRVAAAPLHTVQCAARDNPRVMEQFRRAREPVTA